MQTYYIVYLDYDALDTGTGCSGSCKAPNKKRHLMNKERAAAAAAAAATNEITPILSAKNHSPVLSDG